MSAAAVLWLCNLSVVFVGPPEDDASGAWGLRSFAGSSEIVSQLPVWCQREFTVQTRGHAQSRHGEAYAAQNLAKMYTEKCLIACAAVLAAHTFM